MPVDVSTRNLKS